MPIPWVCPALRRHTPYAIAGLLMLEATGAIAAGDAETGARAFQACAACHSLEPGRHRTGPSLAGVLGREAGSAEGFHRYSPALQASGVVWNEATLDAWIADPRALVPGNRMIFRGLADAKTRADLVAYLAQADHTAAQGAGDEMTGMGGGDLPDLKTLGPEHRVTAVRYCRDTYEVATADGTSEPYWETNLRFKTDSSGLGPPPGKPVIVGAGMMGDRASIIFAAPTEISAFIRSAC
ncbi:MAG: cytochrome c family protein [Geminicoccaceae bacterium]